MRGGVLPAMQERGCCRRGKLSMLNAFSDAKRFSFARLLCMSFPALARFARQKAALLRNSKARKVGRWSCVDSKFLFFLQRLVNFVKIE